VADVTRDARPLADIFLQQSSLGYGILRKTHPEKDNPEKDL
jgi:hypothetical protein